MGRQNQNELALPDGTKVGYSLTERDGGYRVRFLGPDGRRVERSTGYRTKGDARGAAADIIKDVYRPALPPTPTKAGWDAVLADLDATPDLRPDSVRAYRTAINALRKVFPNLEGPADVTPELAHRFKREFMAGTYTRGKASDAKRYGRGGQTCKSYLRSLRSVWKKHFRPLGHVRDNPWLDVPYPNVPRGKRVRVPNEEIVQAFFDWLVQKYPAWELPRLFVTVKALIGCRTIDLCKVQTFYLGAGTLTLVAEATKTREARTVKLPADVVEDLRRLAGPVWLWERSLEETKQYRPAPKILSKKEYNPSTWRWTIQNLFREFNEGRPPEARLRPHDLRARAITLVAAATQSVDATAQAMGVDPQTARHYLDAKKAFDGTEILKQAAEVLRPKASPKE